MPGRGGSPGGGVGSYFAQGRGTPAEFDRCSRAIPVSKQPIGGRQALRLGALLTAGCGEHMGPRFGQEAPGRLR